AAGKQLRLEQQYFFVSCSLQDMIRIYLQRAKTFDKLHEKYVVQLNDTHPTIAIAELMRLLVDEHRLEWQDAWQITTRVFAYTNHTLLPEALEKWPLSLFARVLPRHLEMIYEINRRFLDQVQSRFPGDAPRLARLSLIEEGRERYVRMAHLACVGSHAINGVAALHTRLLEETVLKDFHDLWPEKFSNKTNGVTQRRFVRLANPGLSRLITEAIGDDWITRGDRLRGLERFAADAAFRQKWVAIKVANKTRLAAVLERATGVRADPATLFDVQVKRIHEYKRQHLNMLHAVTLYHRLKSNPRMEMTPRTIVVAGKAAPGYAMAKLIIKLVNSVAEVVNRDREVNDRLKIAFFPNFSVKTAHGIYPGADLSEQISTAGTEASGTGNMKFAFNGALTIGTLDGANVEIRDEVGAENFFLFGMTADEVRRRRAQGYQPRELYQADPELRAAIDLISSGAFSRGDRGLFRPLVDSMLDYDPYFVLADYAAYVDCQETVAETFQDPDRWTRMSVLNVARMGKFSSDRAIAEYCRDIWNIAPVPVAIGDE
ncbi:MAG TPA: glycogen/starch/alpha-glucan phosphorylase, partial [Pirellulales bacterium]|nr:glycogen/starch/alpha-glucan phosphorylase [Pirellulales bacterium]